MAAVGRHGMTCGYVVDVDVGWMVGRALCVPKDLTLEAVQMGLWQNPGTLVLNYRLAS